MKLLLGKLLFEIERRAVPILIALGNVTPKLIKRGQRRVKRANRP
jgi:hypothetical protein